MKKFFTLLAAAVVSLAASAQSIKFTADDVATGLDGKSFGADGFTISIVDKNTKCAVDGNSSMFGTEEDYVTFDYRLKTGGKSSSNNNMTLAIPAAGTLKVYARTGKNADTDRNVVFTQNDTELLNKVLLESEAITVKYTNADGEEKTKNYYPVISIPVQAGTVNITYPTNSVNFYGFELVAGESASVNAATVGKKTPAKMLNGGAVVISTDNGTFNAAGARVK